MVFPDRDFVTIEGHRTSGSSSGVKQDRVVGSPRRRRAAAAIAFEISHPGSYCWAAGTGLSVTPNIVASDVVSITFPDGSDGDEDLPGAAVTKDMALSGRT